MKKMFLALFCSMLAAGTAMAAELNADSFLAMKADAQAAAINSASPASLVALFSSLADKATPLQKSNATDALLAILNKNKETAPADTEALVKQLNSAVDFLNIVKNEKGIYINKPADKVKAGEAGEKGVSNGAESTETGAGAEDGKNKDGDNDKEFERGGRNQYGKVTDDDKNGGDDDNDDKEFERDGRPQYGKGTDDGTHGGDIDNLDLSTFEGGNGSSGNGDDNYNNNDINNYGHDTNIKDDEQKKEAIDPDPDEGDEPQPEPGPGPGPGPSPEPPISNPSSLL